MGISTRGSRKTSDNVLYVYTIPIVISLPPSSPLEILLTSPTDGPRASEMKRSRPRNDASQVPATLPLVRVIAMPADANPNGDIFGGWLLAQMDLAGGSLAAQRAQGRCATVAVDGMVFHEPVFVGDEVSCYGELVRTGRTSMTVRIEAWRRHLASDEVRKVTEAIFTYVAIGENRRPRPLPAIPHPARSATDPCS
jgi:acyl-CoA thioesterase YciA